MAIGPAPRPREMGSISTVPAQEGKNTAQLSLQSTHRSWHALDTRSVRRGVASGIRRPGSSEGARVRTRRPRLPASAVLG